MVGLRCSFCGKRESEEERLIAGPTVCICNECVVLCVSVLDEDPAGLVATTDGQLLVRFPDGTIHVCEQQHEWQPFLHDGEHLDWCVAAGFARSSTPVPVLAVRRHGASGLVVGATFPDGTMLTETHARGVLDAGGGTARWTASGAPLPLVTVGGKSKPPGPRLMGFLTAQETATFLSQQSRIPTISLEEYEVPNEILRFVSKELCEKLVVLPVSRAGTSLIVAMVDPKDHAALDELKLVSGFNIEPVIATEQAIRSAVERYYEAI